MRSGSVIEYDEAMVQNPWLGRCVLPFLIFVCIMASAWAFDLPEAHAQSGTTHGDDFSFFLGHHLPSQIEGVADILPVFGGRYGFGTNFGAIELGLQNSHAMGVDFTTLTLDVRGEFPISAGVSGLLYAGPVLNYYTRKNTENRLTEYGLEAGTGAMMLVSDTLWLRADLKYMGGPGSSLYLLFGVVLRTGSGNP